MARDNVVLIGMAYAGKSTIGPLLARRLLFDYLDTDLLIQSREEATLQDLIAREGGEGFSALEAYHVCSLQCQRRVIATGGSVVYREDAMRHLQALGPVVWLDVPLEVLAGRVQRAGTRGLVIAPGMDFADLVAERRPLYERWAGVRIDCDDAPAEVLAGRIAEYVRSLQTGGV